MLKNNNRQFHQLNRPLSLKNQVKTGAMIFGVASMLIVGIIIILISFNFQRQKLDVWLQEVNQKSTLQMENYLNDLIREADHLGRIPGLTEMTREIQQQFLLGLIRLNKAYEMVALLDRHGQLMTHVSNFYKPEETDFSNSAPFIYAFKRKELYISLATNEKNPDGETKETIVVAAPTRNKQDAVDGVAFIKINLMFLKHILTQIHVGKTGRVFILDESNHLLICSKAADCGKEDVTGRFAAQPSANSNTFTSYPVLKLLHREKHKNKTLSLQYKNFHNINVLGNIDYIRPVYWKLIVEIPIQEADALTYQMIRILLISLFIIAALIILVSIKFVNKMILTPLQEFIMVTHQIINGSLDTLVKIESPVEFKLLSYSFNSMLNTLRHRIDFETFIINISNRFINFDSNNINKCIEQSLKEINIFLNTDFVFFHYIPQERNLKKSIFYQSENSIISGTESSTGEVLDVHTFIEQCFNHAWYKRQVERSEHIFISTHGAIPKEAFLLNELVKENHILSFLHIPITTAENVSGILGIHSIHGRKNWDKSDLMLLKVVAETFLNVFEQIRTKKELIDSERKYKDLTNTLPQIIFEIEATYPHHITFANQFALLTFGYSEEDLRQGLSLKTFFTAPSWKKVLETITLIIKGSKPFETEYMSQKKNGVQFPVLMHPIPIHKNNAIIGMRGVMLDLTERKKTEDELLKIQKLESIGILSGGIAHDFNNILSSITGNISLAKYSLQTQTYGELEEILDDAQIACFRARELTHQLLTFSKGGTPIKKLGSISQVIWETARFCLRGSSIDLQLKIEPDLRSVEFDEGQICQVINNLLINAKQAMPQGGKIEIFVTNISERLPAHFSFQEGHYIKIEVQDTGTGIPETILDKIFDPYFTTKQNGSGLGLTTVYSIIKQHGGFIDVTSDNCRGACFTIYLPASDIIITDGIIEHVEKYNLQNDKKILVMDDDVNLRKTVKTILNKLGYEADIAEEGTEAIEKYKKAFLDQNQYNAVILDLTVQQGKGGKETIKCLRDFDTNIKAIVSSGYSTDPVMAEYEKYGFNDILVKPYTIEDLGKVLVRLFANT